MTLSILRPHVHRVRLYANVRSMELTFYLPSDPAIPFQDERNRGMDAVPALLERLERRGAHVRRIDPLTLTAERRFEEYTKATIPAVYKKYEVKRVFGTNRHSACWFGLQVPALVVKPTPDAVGDTYPHRESGNRIVTIHEFLTATVAVPDETDRQRRNATRESSY